MSQFDYSRAAATAARLIARYGLPITITKTSGGTYNPATRTVEAAASQTWTPAGVKLDYQAREIDGTNVIAGDQRLYLEALPGMSIGPGCAVVTAGETWRVVIARPLAPAGVTICVEAQIRRA